MSTPAQHAVEGIIFDLDGTLLDWEGISHEALAKPLERRGVSLTWEQHGSIIGTKAEDWSRQLIAESGLADQLQPAAYAAEVRYKCLFRVPCRHPTSGRPSEDCQAVPG